MMQSSVLVVGNFTPSSNRLSADLAERLRGSGWTVLTSSARAGRVARAAEMVSSAWRRRGSYHVAEVDVYSRDAFLWAEAVCWTLRRAGKPYVLTLHGGGLPGFAADQPERVRRLLNSAAAVTAPSRYLAEQMEPYRTGIRMIPNGRDLERFRFRLRERPEPHLLWLRRFHRDYNPTLAPRVLARLTREFPEIRLTMVGPDSGDGSLEAVKAVAGEEGVADRLSLPGPTDRAGVPRHLDRADLFLNTTDVDNTPLSVLEAMAAGLPVVTTDVGGLPYLLDNGRDSLLVPPDDPDGMAEAVGRVLREPGLAASLGRAARAKVEAYDWSVVLPQWEQLLSAVANGKPA